MPPTTADDLHASNTKQAKHPHWRSRDRTRFDAASFWPKKKSHCFFFDNKPWKMKVVSTLKIWVIAVIALNMKAKWVTMATTMECISVRSGLTSHYFHMIECKLINPIVGVYKPSRRILSRVICPGPTDLLVLNIRSHGKPVGGFRIEKYVGPKKEFCPQRSSVKHPKNFGNTEHHLCVKN